VRLLDAGAAFLEAFQALCRATTGDFPQRARAPSGPRGACVTDGLFYGFSRPRDLDYIAELRQYDRRHDGQA
jgi:hypothetical protein